MNALRRLLGAANRAIVANAGSLVGTSAISAALGFVYWWVAARRFAPESVGFASASISAMMLLATIASIGLGTLVIGELPRQPAGRGALVTAALAVAGAAGAALGLLFALLAPLISAEFRPLSDDAASAGLFTLGVALTAVAMVLDQALIGLLRGGLQLGRNIIFSLVKLVALLAAGGWLSDKSGESIYAAWTLGAFVSLALLAAFVAVRGVPADVFRPRWGVLRGLGAAAFSHYLLNLALQIAYLALPVMVTQLLSASVNASFYIAWLIASLLSAIPYALTTVLYAVSAAEPAALAQKIRLTLGLSLTSGVLACAVLLVGADLVLGLFGPVYAQEGAWTLRILMLGLFPLAIKDHYVAIRRVAGQVTSTALFAAAGGVLELLFAALGARLDGLTGLSIGWLIALVLEALLMARTVYRAAYPQAAPLVPAPAPALAAPE